VIGATTLGSVLMLIPADVRQALRTPVTRKPKPAPPPGTGRTARALRTVAGPIAHRSLQRIVCPLILMGTVFGINAILAPALCQRSGHLDATGFVMAAISLGGVIGALAYSSLKLETTLRRNHAVLGLIFAAPMLFAVFARSPWVLGALLAVAGLAVTPLYINSYLMMDNDVPEEEIHEANTWVPVGNDVGYVVGITLAVAILGRGQINAALASVSCAAAVLLPYSLGQLLADRTRHSPRTGHAAPAEAEA